MVTATRCDSKVKVAAFAGISPVRAGVNVMDVVGPALAGSLADTVKT